jgi:hypothetical protein
VLPPIINESEVSPFKFWFNDGIQDGMYYQSDLFHRLLSVDSSRRAQLYHYACKLAQTERIVVTASDKGCSLWISLRSPGQIILNLKNKSASLV